MIRTILVPVTGGGADERALEAALEIGRHFDAVIECLQIRLGNAEIIRAAALGQFRSGVSNTELLRSLQQQSQEAAKEASAVVERFRGAHAVHLGHGVSVEQHEIVGDPVQETIAHARYSDLLVLARNEKAGAFDTGDLGSILMACGRPVVLAPAEPVSSYTKTVVIAWKETAEAARAVTAAMPLMYKAERLVVLSVEETGGDTDAIAAAAGGLATRLRKHGLTVEAKSIARENRSAPETLLDAVRTLGGDLLVMGAYGHSRARELVFGGFTRHVLTSAQIPVFLFH